MLLQSMNLLFVDTGRATSTSTAVVTAGIYTSLFEISQESMLHFVSRHLRVELGHYCASYDADTASKSELQASARAEFIRDLLNPFCNPPAAPAPAPAVVDDGDDGDDDDDADDDDVVVTGVTGVAAVAICPSDNSNVCESSIPSASSTGTDAASTLPVVRAASPPPTDDTAGEMPIDMRLRRPAVTISDAHTDAMHFPLTGLRVSILIDGVPEFVTVDGFDFKGRPVVTHKGERRIISD